MMQLPEGGLFPRFRFRVPVRSVSALALCALAAASHAGGESENLLLIVDPTNPDAMYIANHYRSVRGVPDCNILYMRPEALSYASFVDGNQAATVGTLANRAIADHIDYVLVGASTSFYVPASGYITDGCASVRRFALPSNYTLMFMSDAVFGGLPSSTRNEYYGPNDRALAFSSSQGWYNGEPDGSSSARRYFLGTQLGYLGELGNTVEEIISIIDSSAAVDGTFPNGTFYFMETNDALRSGPRDGFFDAVVQAIIDLGGQAEHLCCNALPSGRHDVLGCMTGAAGPDIDGTDMTIQPGSFCDHLTSYAGTFDTSSQVKMSRWIANGASGSHGTVEEPCNYPGKFPHPRVHLYYFKGLTLGEAVFRSLRYVPFQGLVLGDPLTRPYSHIPEVTVEDAPVGPVSGIITLTPSATTTHPTAVIATYDLYVDGLRWLTALPNEVFHLDTTRFGDGFHSVRVVATDSSDQKTPGAWNGTIEITNHGLSASLAVAPLAGDLSTAFDCTVDGSAGDVVEARILHNGRVIATSSTLGQPATIYGLTTGAGTVDLRAEIVYVDGSRVTSDTVTLGIENLPGTPTAVDPIAYGYTTSILVTDPLVIELPAAFDNAADPLSFTIVEQPTQAVFLPAASTDPYRVLVPNSDAAGADRFTFQASSSTGQSAVVAVNVSYGRWRPGDMHLDVSPLFAGQDATFTVIGGYPDEKTYLAYSLKGEGRTYTPQLNVTLDLERPSQAGNVQYTDMNGTVAWVLHIPKMKTPKLAWFQAAQRSATSNLAFGQIN